MTLETSGFHEQSKNLAEGTAALPDRVLNDQTMTIGAKRALLASWASDAHAVPDRPTLRRLDNGAVVAVSEILRALRSLDRRAQQPGNIGLAFDRHRRKDRLKWIRRPWRDDDDDPPPSPVNAAVPPRFGGGGMLAEPEHAVA